MFEQGRVPDEGIPTIVNMVDALDGYQEGGVTIETSEERVLDDGTVRRDTTATVRFAKLGLVDQLFHTVASPAVTYLLLLIGLALLIFEFFTAGVGVAGVVGATCVVLACTGLATLPARGWAVAMILVAMLAFAIDVQVGIPRFWTGVGIGLTILASLLLFEPLPGVTLRPSWITLLAGIGGTTLAFVVGMPSMVRTRFATPTIGTGVDDRRARRRRRGRRSRRCGQRRLGPLAGADEPGDPGHGAVSRCASSRSTVSRSRSSRSRGPPGTIASGATHLTTESVSGP